MKIYQFLLWHELNIKFIVKLYTWNDVHREVYQRIFKNIPNKEHEKIAVYHVSDVKDLAAKCSIEICSLGTSSYFNADSQ